MTNELMAVENEKTFEIGEILPTGETVVQDNPQYTIFKQEDGKYRKEMKYSRYASHIPTDKAQLMELYTVLNEDNNPDVTPLKEMVNQEFTIIQAYTTPYESFDEETGGTSNGVNTTILTENGYVATSSKSVYYSLFNLFKVFGHPSTEDYEPIKVRVTSTKMQNGNQLNIQLVTN